MTTPTKRLTNRANDRLHEDIVLAVRVRKGPRPDVHVSSESRTVPFGPFPAGGLPVVPAFRSLKRGITDLFAGPDVLRGVLAFSSTGERILMGRSRFVPLRPTEKMRHLPADVPIDVDLALLAEHLLPEITIGDESFIVNSVDFGALTRAVVNGELDEPALAEQLGPYYEHAKALATYDPDTLRSMMSK